MDIVLSPHALEKMAQRLISESDIQAVLSQPDSIRESYRQRRVLAAVVRGRQIAIVLTPITEDPPTLITAYLGRE